MTALESNNTSILVQDSIKGLFGLQTLPEKNPELISSKHISKDQVIQLLLYGSRDNWINAWNWGGYADEVPENIERLQCQIYARLQNPSYQFEENEFRTGEVTIMKSIFHEITQRIGTGTNATQKKVTESFGVTIQHLPEGARMKR